MIELNIQAVFTDDAGMEDAASIRERLKARFAPGATRRMTTLGMLVGSVLAPLDPRPDDAILYASGFAESCALEGFLDSLPAASPTLFQTSIHPSAVQQLMISRQQPVREFLPLSGGALLGFHALRAAGLARARRVLVCGGEERATWLTEHGLASERAFAFGMGLSREALPGALGRIRLAPAAAGGHLGLGELFALLHARRAHRGPVAPGWTLELEWL